MTKKSSDSNNKITGFKKDDKGKNQLSLIDPNFILQIGKVLTYGASKYSIDNWKKGVENIDESKRRFSDAALRHLYAYLAGTEINAESGLSHLAHVSTNLMALMYFDEYLHQKKNK